MSKPLQQHRYMPGLDGLRAFAVLAVILYHLNTDWAPGGLLGVGIFFVLSGYLITDILAGQWERNHRFDMVDFWKRRARRLLPAMYAMIAVVALWCLIGDHGRLAALQGDVPAALLYISNWWFIFHKVSYFESFGPASPLGHLWSLAVEEQFYLIWPFVLMLGLKFLPKRGNLAGWILSLSLISALLMAVLYVPGSDPSRVYYGTDTRIFALLIGSALAIVWPSVKLKANVSAPAQTLLDGVGLAALFVLLWSIWHTNEYEPFLYRGGLVLISVITAILIAVLAHPASRLAVLVGCKPLRWLGQRSYGLYLWHFPVITLSTPQVDTGEPSVIRAVLQVLVSLALAELSWRFVEQPIRRKGFRYAFGRVGSSNWRSRRGWIIGGSSAAVFILSAAVLGHLLTKGTASETAEAEQQPQSVFITGSSSTSPTNVSHTTKDGKEGDAVGGKNASGSGDTKSEDGTTKDSDGKASSDSKDTGKSNDDASGATDTGDKNASSTDGSDASDDSKSGDDANTVNTDSTDNSDSGSTSGDGQKLDSPAPSLPAAATKKNLEEIVSGNGVTAIGDSVMLDVAHYLTQTMPGITIDGRVGRQMTEAPDVIRQLRRGGHLGSTVVLELGTNGSFTREQLEDLLDELSSARKIILVNTRVPRAWESLVNDTINAVAAEDNRITVVDWYSASKGQDSFFATDGVHVNPAGARVYATIVAKAVKGK